MTGPFIHTLVCECVAPSYPCNQIGEHDAEGAAESLQVFHVFLGSRRGDAALSWLAANASGLRLERIAGDVEGITGQDAARAREVHRGTAGVGTLARTEEYRPPHRYGTTQVFVAFVEHADTLGVACKFLTDRTHVRPGTNGTAVHEPYDAAEPLELV
jgi:hypothetical protein